CTRAPGAIATSYWFFDLW
nr:immunoglobulin heavy chain junction region [Macaca mulatta]